MTLTLRAPGKVNLGLRILGRRADGYHRLESLFLPTRPRGHGSARAAPRARASGSPLSGECAGVPADERNLAFRAAAGLPGRGGPRRRRRDPSSTSACPRPAGSAGAPATPGAVLRGLAELLPGAVAPGRLRSLALGLGADVPFFLAPQPALVTGSGRRSCRSTACASRVLLLAHPGAALATAAVYAEYDAGAASLTPSDAGPSIRALLALREEAGRARAGPFETSLRALAVNDLEPAASRLCPAVSELRKEIEATGALAVSLSGSGPTVFGVFPDEAAAGEAQRRIARRPGLRTWVVRTAPSAGLPATGPAGA